MHNYSEPGTLNFKNVKCSQLPIGQNDEYTRVAKLFVSKVFLILVHFFYFYTLNPNDVRGNVKEGEKRTGLTEKLPAEITLFRLPPTRRKKI